MLIWKIGSACLGWLFFGQWVRLTKLSWTILFSPATAKQPPARLSLGGQELCHEKMSLRPSYDSVFRPVDKAEWNVYVLVGGVILLACAKLCFFLGLATIGGWIWLIAQLTGSQ
ncbi:hypothetical protein K2Q16_01440 [Patescibacteria group bacterium]|nr:hypothetical protein [Patescibacteria group bacterium]